MQRAYYEDKASEAFAEIPHQIVDNPFMAEALARVVGGFYRDCAIDPAEALYGGGVRAGAGAVDGGCAVGARAAGLCADRPRREHARRLGGQRCARGVGLRAL